MFVWLTRGTSFAGPEGMQNECQVWSKELLLWLLSFYRWHIQTSMGFTPSSPDQIWPSRVCAVHWSSCAHPFSILQFKIPVFGTKNWCSPQTQSIHWMKRSFERLILSQRGPLLQCLCWNCLALVLRLVMLTLLIWWWILIITWCHLPRVCIVSGIIFSRFCSQKFLPGLPHYLIVLRTNKMNPFWWKQLRGIIFVLSLKTTGCHMQYLSVE